jgi:hypothetical protein
MARLTVIATTGDRFSGFAPYVASVNDAGTVAFQAALCGGGSGVFTGEGGEVEEVVGPSVVGRVWSHPDLNNAGELSFYGDLLDGRQAVFLLRDGHQAIADTHGPFVSIGPFGPTMNEAGAVAFRADGAPGVSGIYAADGTAVTKIAETDGPWSGFHGLPVMTGEGAVVFRADRKDGVQGIYTGRGGSVEPVAETGDRFESFGRFPSADEQGTVAFAATFRGGGEAIFTAEGGRATPIGETGEAFESYRGALITNTGGVVRVATPRGGSLGLFSGPDPEADRILAGGDPLLGSTVSELGANPVSVNSAGQVAISATLVDGRQAILRADPGG